MVNRCLEQYLRCFASEKPRSRINFLSWAEFWYNSTYHGTIGMSPFEALYGRPPPIIPRYNFGASPIHEVDASLLTRDTILARLKVNLQDAINQMKQQADTKRRPVDYEVGDFVYLKLKPYRKHYVHNRVSQKLASRYYGPFEILECIGPIVYCLKLPDGARIHSVFNVSALKKHIGEDRPCSTTLPNMDDEGSFLIEPDTILATRTVRRGNKITGESLT